MNEYITKYHFCKMGENIYFRRHDYICLDVIEIVKKEKYYTVELCVYCFLDKQSGFYCVAYRNLGTLKKLLFNEYWWLRNNDDTEIVELLETVGEEFWKQYSSLESIKKSIYYYMEHGFYESDSSYNKENFDNFKLLFYFALVNDNIKQAELLSGKLSLCFLDDKNNMSYDEIPFEKRRLCKAWTYFSKSGYHMYLDLLKNSMQEILEWMSKQDDEESFEDRNESWIYYYSENEENEDV